MVNGGVDVVVDWGVDLETFCLVFTATVREVVAKEGANANALWGAWPRSIAATATWPMEYMHLMNREESMVREVSVLLPIVPIARRIEIREALTMTMTV